MGKPVFLLGAGASIDAGLFDTNRLTREVYGILRKDHYKVPAQVFGYVIAKILARKIRKDGSPFDDVNVEEAYDGVERLVYRDRDLTSEFVSSWDPFLDSLRPAFDKDRFARKIKDSFQFLDGRYMSGTPTFNIDSSRLKDAADEIGRAMVTSTFAGQSNILPYLTNALLRTLQHDAAKIQYMSEILQIADSVGGIVGSLNYDLVAEDALSSRELTYDYGLSAWNDRKIVTFSGSRANIRLIKLHGSMNWQGNDDAITVEDQSRRGELPMLVFGGASGKLRPDGPFLQLRHEFERHLLSTNVFVIVGYSFGDGHLNAIVRRWVSTRRKAKLVIVNPNSVDYRQEIFGRPYVVGKDGKLQSKTVDITHIRKTAAQSVDDVSEALRRPISLSIQKHGNGLLPDILVRNVA